MWYYKGTMPDLFVSSESHKETSPSTSHSTVSEKQSQTAKAVPLSSNNLGLLSAFCEKPTSLTFEHQENGEVIYLVIRRHVITNLRWVVTTIGFSFLPILLPILFSLAGLSFVFLSPLAATIALILYYLFLFGYALTHFVTWFYTLGIVTQKQVIDIDSYNLLHRSIAATHLEDIVDGEYTQKGLLAGFFNYGDVHLQTEGIKANFEFMAAPNPAHVVDVVIDLKQTQKHEH